MRKIITFGEPNIGQKEINYLKLLALNGLWSDY